MIKISVYQTVKIIGEFNKYFARMNA